MGPEYEQEAAHHTEECIEHGVLDDGANADVLKVTMVELIPNNTLFVLSHIHYVYSHPINNNWLGLSVVSIIKSNPQTKKDSLSMIILFTCNVNGSMVGSR